MNDHAGDSLDLDFFIDAEIRDRISSLFVMESVGETMPTGSVAVEPEMGTFFDRLEGRRRSLRSGDSRLLLDNESQLFPGHLDAAVKQLVADEAHDAVVHVPGMIFPPAAISAYAASKLMNEPLSLQEEFSLLFTGGVGTIGIARGLRGAGKTSLVNAEKQGTMKCVLEGGKARVAKYGKNWQKAGLQKEISRHAGPDATSWQTRSGKTIYENPSTGRQVVVDDAGYFRILQPKSFGSKAGKYLDRLGNVPSPARRLKSGAIRSIPLTGDDLEAYTHFLMD